MHVTCVVGQANSPRSSASCQEPTRAFPVAMPRCIMLVSVEARTAGAQSESPRKTCRHLGRYGVCSEDWSGQFPAVLVLASRSWCKVQGLPTGQVMGTDPPDPDTCNQFFAHQLGTSVLSSKESSKNLV